MYEKDGEAMCKAVVGNFRILHLCLCSCLNNQEKNEMLQAVPRHSRNPQSFGIKFLFVHCHMAVRRIDLLRSDFGIPMCPIF